jgi:hypothetical protein
MARTGQGIDRAGQGEVVMVAVAVSSTGISSIFGIFKIINPSVVTNGSSNRSRGRGGRGGRTEVTEVRVPYHLRSNSVTARGGNNIGAWGKSVGCIALPLGIIL